jgi:hypothetical protein
MSWWMILIAAFVLLRLARRHRWEQRALRGWPGYFPGLVRGPWWADGSGLHRGHATSAPPPPAVPDPRRDLERTIDAVRQEYVAGRITVQEYERRLDELYRTAEGKRLTGS